MEYVKFRKSINLPISKTSVYRLKYGHGYIMAQMTREQIKHNHGADCIEYSTNFENIYGDKRYEGQDLNGKKIIVWRTGGAGDLLFLSPIIKKIKETFKDVHITLGTSIKYISIFDYFPYVDTKTIIPIDSNLLEESDYYCILEGLIERNKEAARINAYDLFADRFAVKHLMEDHEKRPVVFISELENSWAKNIIGNSKRNISIQAAASSILRTFDINKLMKVVEHFSKNGYTVYLLGGPANAAQIDAALKTIKHTDNVKNIAALNPTWLQSAAIIKNSNLFIGPDSSQLHMAAAFEIPCLGIYGPFSSDVRMKYYKNAVAIDANAACKPCYAHGQLPCKWVRMDSGLGSKCFDCISHDLIINVAEQILEKTSGM